MWFWILMLVANAFATQIDDNPIKTINAIATFVIGTVMIGYFISNFIR